MPNFRRLAILLYVVRRIPFAIMVVYAMFVLAGEFVVHRLSRQWKGGLRAIRDRRRA